MQSLTTAMPQTNALAPGSQAGDTVEISDLWRILRRRWIWIAGTVVLLVAATLLYGLLTSSLYTATAQIIIDPRGRQVLVNDLNPSGVAPDGGTTQVESQVSVVQSSSVLLRAIAATNLTKDPEFNGSGLFGLLGRSAKLPDDLPPDAALSDDEVRTLDALRRSISVKRPDKLLVIDIEVTAHGAAKAALLANAIADAYMADQADARAQSAEGATDALTARLSGLRSRVEEASNAVERYRADHDLVSATGQLVDEQQLTDANRELSAAQSRTAALKARIDQINQQRQGGASADAIAEAMQSPVIAKLREQESTLAQSEATLEIQLGPLHPNLGAVQVQLRNVRQAIARELGRIAQSARADYERAAANERALSAKLDALKGQTLANDQASVRLRELQRDLDAVRTVYNTYLVRSQETREQTNIDSANARIITRATPPQKRSWPRMKLLLAGALIGGIGLGVGLALVREYMSPTVLSVDDAQAISGAPVFGVLAPMARFRGLAVLLPGGRRRASRASDESARTESLVYLTLRRLFDANHPARPGIAMRSLLVTSSPEDGAERERTALLLACAAATRGERVLLIDADAAHSMQAAGVGLLEVARGQRSLESVARFEAGRCVALMDTGRRQLMPQGARGHARNILSEARHHFDFVVVDGGAVAENLKIAPLVATVDRVLFVGCLTVTHQRELQAATQALAVMGRSAAGMLLVDPMARA